MVVRVVVYRQEKHSGPTIHPLFSCGDLNLPVQPFYLHAFVGRDSVYFNPPSTLRPVLHTHFSPILIFLPGKISIYSVSSPGKMSIY